MTLFWSVSQFPFAGSENKTEKHNNIHSSTNENLLCDFFSSTKHIITVAQTFVK